MRMCIQVFPCLDGHAKKSPPLPPNTRDTPYKIENKLAGRREHPAKAHTNRQQPKREGPTVPEDIIAQRSNRVRLVVRHDPDAQAVSCKQQNVCVICPSLPNQKSSHLLPI